MNKLANSVLRQHSTGNFEDEVVEDEEYFTNEPKIMKSDQRAEAKGGSAGILSARSGVRPGPAAGACLILLVPEMCIPPKDNTVSPCKGRGEIAVFVGWEIATCISLHII